MSCSVNGCGNRVDQFGKITPLFYKLLDDDFGHLGTFCSFRCRRDFIEWIPKENNRRNLQKHQDRVSRRAAEADKVKNSKNRGKTKKGATGGAGGSATTIKGFPAQKKFGYNESTRSMSFHDKTLREWQDKKKGHKYTGKRNKGSA